MVPPPIASWVLRKAAGVEAEVAHVIEDLAGPTSNSTRIETRLIDRYSASRKRVGPL